MLIEHIFRAIRRPFSSMRLWSCAVPLISGCIAVPPITGVSPEPQILIPKHLLAAYVIVGENGLAWARTISPVPAEAGAETGCPAITVDGTSQRMSLRAPAGTIAQRVTASDRTHSKPSQFPVFTCEFAIPEKATNVSVDGINLRLPKTEPQRIVVLGDTGCRMKKADNAWQACLDSKEWPFRAIANAAAASAPDLVLHMGDYHYRENECPPNVAGCQGSPWGYGWDTWRADLFEPAANLLAAAPWVVARGNHEECRRAGQGWFRFLETRPFGETQSCDDEKNDAVGNFTPPYAVPISRDLQLIVFDSAYSGNGPLDLSKRRDLHAFNEYRRQFVRVDELAAKAGVTSIFIGHHPILGFSSDRKTGATGGSPALLSVMKTLHPQSYYPSSVNLALHGHVHLFEAINFSSNHPATIVSGVGGDETYINLPDPFPIDLSPAEGVTLDRITHSNEFGFLVMDKQQTGWRIGAYDAHGKLTTTCILTGSKLRCDKTGLLK